MLFLKYSLGPISLLCCHARWSPLSKPHIPLNSVVPPTSCKKLQICVTYVNWGSLRQQPWFKIRKVLWGLQTTCTSCFLQYNIIKGQFIPCPSQILFNSFFILYMYELYSVCASLLCETQKDETKQKRWQKHYREDKKTVCWWNSDHVI